MSESKITNPFVHEAATNINDDLLYKMFIASDNSNVIANQKNVFVKGYRGSGKSMLMRYNSFPIQRNNQEESTRNNDLVGVYVSCTTPLFRRQDIQLNDSAFIVDVMSEHLLVLTMAERFIANFQSVEPDFFDDEDLETLVTEFGFYFDLEFKPEKVLESIQKHFKKQLAKSQEHLNSNPEGVFSDIHTYSSLILPLIDVFKSTKQLSNTHFSFLIDDGQMLNQAQKMALNGWLSYRDLSNVSFKIAITSIDDYVFYTPQKSVILEGHDYIVIDLEKDQFSAKSGFVDFAKKIIEKRLELCGLSNIDANDFFPIPEDFSKRMDDIRNKFIEGGYPERADWDSEQRRKSASKYTRSIYFRLNHEKTRANPPRNAYTGFDVITNISTGVVRNLLAPCYIMYERQADKDDSNPKYIEPMIQYETLLEESAKAWNEITELSVQIIDCTDQDTIALKNALENFGDYLKDKLLDPSASEKKILTFTISDLDESPYKDRIEKILDIGVQGGLIYTRVGSDHSGGKTKWYTPKRILWPALGLDPVGQNGRKNFLAKEFNLMMDDKTYMERKLSSPIALVQGELDI